LSGFVDLPDRDRYLQAAKRMLDELASPAYLAAGTPSPAVLLHGVGNLPEGKAVDAGLIYGDYYFIEALARLRTASPSGTDGGPWEEAPRMRAVPLLRLHPCPPGVAPAGAMLRSAHSPSWRALRCAGGDGANQRQ